MVVSVFEVHGYRPRSEGVATMHTDLNALGTARSSTDAIPSAGPGALLVEPVLIALRRIAQTRHP